MKRDGITLLVTVRGDEPLLSKTVKAARANAGEDIRVVIAFDGRKAAASERDLADEIVELAEPMGCMRARHEGLQRIEKGVAVIIDAHVAFSDGWAADIAKTFRNPRNNKNVYCFATGGLTTDFERIADGADARMRTGARLVWRRDLDVAADVAAYHPRALSRVWAESSPGCNVPCVLGGAYAMRRTWYKTIGEPWEVGTTWGRSEETLSIPTWLAGGQCKVYGFGVRAWHCFQTPWAATQTLQEMWVNSMRLLHILPMPKADRDGLIDHCVRAGLPGDQKALFALLKADIARPEVKRVKKHLNKYRAKWAEVRGARIDNDEPTILTPIKPPARQLFENGVVTDGGEKLYKPQPLKPQRDVCESCDSVNTFRVVSSIMRDGRRVQYLKCSWCGKTGVRINDDRRIITGVESISFGNA